MKAPPRDCTPYTDRLPQPLVLRTAVAVSSEHKVIAALLNLVEAIELLRTDIVAINARLTALEQRQ